MYERSLTPQQLNERAAFELLAIELWKQEWGYYATPRATDLMWNQTSRQVRHEYRQRVIKLLQEG